MQPQEAAIQSITETNSRYLQDAYDPLGAQAKRAAGLRTAYAYHKRKQPFKLDLSRNLQGCEEDSDSI
jgi:hypothetical protein